MRSRSLLLALLVVLASLVAWWVASGKKTRTSADTIGRTTAEPALDSRLEDPPTPATLTGSGEVAQSTAKGRGDVRVLVRGRDGKPFPDFPLAPGTKLAEPIGWKLTDERGEAVFANVPYDGSAAIFVPRGGNGHQLRMVNRHPVRGPRLTVRTGLGLPCDVRIVDAESGEALPGVAWAILPYHPRLVDRSVPRRLGPRPVLAMPGSRHELSLRIETPVGYVAWANPGGTDGVSLYAERLHVVHPLHREADVVIDVLEHDDAPAVDPMVLRWGVAGRMRDVATWPITEPEALNRLRLRGVPHLEGADLTVVVGLRDTEDHRAVVARTPIARPTRLVVRLPDPEDYVPEDDPFQAPPEGLIGLGGTPGAPPPDPPSGTLDLRVYRRDGRPAVHASVSLLHVEGGNATRGMDATLNGEGRIRLHLPSGPRRIRLNEPGLVRTETEVTIQAGAVASVTLREPAGGTVFVRVVDETGRPVPFAKLRVEERTWRDLVDGEQRLDSYVDENGTRTLRHVPASDAFRVDAYHLGHRGSHAVAVAEGETVLLIVELKSPR